MSEVLWRRLGYMLSPQLDIYKHIAPELADKSVIDIGFGTGFGTIQFLPYAYRVDGLEIDNEAATFAIDNLPGVGWYTGDIGSEGFSHREQYDAVVMIEVLEHVQDWPTALSNVRKLLKDGGEFYISARNANADLRKNELHEREWTAKDFYDALSLYFNDVTLYDYKLEDVQDTSTRQTPLVARCRKG